MVEIRSLSPAIGVEIRGVDLSKSLDEATFASIRAAWERNCIALFRDQRLEEMDQVNFASRFGPLGKAVNDHDPEKGGNHPAVLYVSNVRVDGRVTGILPDGEMFFHSDTCYMERPAMASMLYAMEVPSHGGNTLYANGFRAYETLPDDIKEFLKGKFALNIYDYVGNPTHRADSLPPDVKQYAHPLVRTHTPTGRKALYVNRLMTWSILGFSREGKLRDSCRGFSIIKKSGNSSTNMSGRPETSSCGTIALVCMREQILPPANAGDCVASRCSARSPTSKVTSRAAESFRNSTRCGFQIAGAQMRVVAVRLRTLRDEHICCVRDALDRGLHHMQRGRIGLVVRPRLIAISRALIFSRSFEGS